MIPGIGPLLRRRVRERMCCAFLGFEDEAETRVGCLLHPTLWNGVDRRRDAAFAILPGFGCNEPGFFCEAAVEYGASTAEERIAFRSKTREMDWFDYGHAVERM